MRQRKLRKIAGELSLVLTSELKHGEKTPIEKIHLDKPDVNDEAISLDFGFGQLVELRASRSHFGYILIPPANENDNTGDMDIADKLTSDAVSFARVLDRVLGSEFSVRQNTCIGVPRTLFT